MNFLGFSAQLGAFEDPVFQGEGLTGWQKEKNPSIEELRDFVSKSSIVNFCQRIKWLIFKTEKAIQQISVN